MRYGKINIMKMEDKKMIYGLVDYNYDDYEVIGYTEDLDEAYKRHITFK